MKTKKAELSQTLLIITLLLVLGPYTISVADTPPPIYHEYHVRGTITRAGSGSKKDFAVVLSSRFSHDTTYQRLRGMNGESERPVSLTDSTGAFFLVVRDARTADSLALMVVVPDRPTIVGQAFSIRIAQVIPITSYVEDEDAGDCSGCTKSPAGSTVTLGYQYHFPDQTVQIPF